MTASINYNWMQQTNAAGTFNIQSTGWVQGYFVPDPAIRYQLAGGVLSNSETLPMWGGVAVNELAVPNTGSKAPDSVLGGIISRATNVTANAAGSITGFSVFDQDYAMTTTPGSPVPLAASGMSVHFFRLGSNARIAVLASPTLVISATINAAVSWDFVNQQLIPYVPAYASATATAAAYNSTTGILSLTYAVAPFGASIGSGANGAYISISGITGTGAGVPQLNGDFPITSTGTSGTVINVQAPIGLVASALTGGTLAAGGGALPVKVIEIFDGNCMTVNYNSVNNTASWNYNGNIAIIII